MLRDNRVDGVYYRSCSAGRPACGAAGTTNGLGGTAPAHHVNVHRALVAFSADDNLSFNAPPPRVALLEWGHGVFTGILPKYMANAGLGFTGAFGCPPGGYLQSDPTNKATYCPTGQQGQIYDNFATSDFANGLMFATDANGNPLYQAIWTPHWDVAGSTFSYPTPTGVTLKSTSGTLPIGTYAYRVSAVNDAGGETLASMEVTITTKA